MELKLASHCFHHQLPPKYIHLDIILIQSLSLFYTKAIRNIVTVQINYMLNSILKSGRTTEWMEDERPEGTGVTWSF